MVTDRDDPHEMSFLLKLVDDSVGAASRREATLVRRSAGADDVGELRQAVTDSDERRLS